MRIEVVDPGGLGLGLAIGLRQLGHVVFYRGAARRRPRHPEFGRMVDELVAHFFGGPLQVDVDSDLLVLVDNFADYLAALEEGRDGDSEVEVDDPLQDDAGSLVYPHRLRYYFERAGAGRQLAVVDTSDRAGPREVGFELTSASLFAREVAVGAAGRWQPLPFLYNTVVLWLEHMRPASDWLTPDERRRQAWDWAFCGTVDHPRYRGRRAQVLRTLPDRWPGSRGVVKVEAPFREVMALLQTTRCGVDLPGQGELCFRLHECLAVGTPVWRPMPPTNALPTALESVVGPDPLALPFGEGAAVRSVYDEHYAPHAAARWLLDGIAGRGDEASRPAGREVSLRLAGASRDGSR